MRLPPIVIVYALTMLPLGLHLYHGFFSMLHTFGATSPKFNRWRRPIALALALVIVLGNISFPVAVLAGIVD